MCDEPIKVKEDIINLIITKNVIVKLESRTLEDRRMDIHIDIGGIFGVCIENKIGADDQPDQIKDYDIYMRNKYANNEIDNNKYRLIYLTPEGVKP